MDSVESAFAIRKLADPLGAEITGIDVGQPMSDATFRRIEDAFHEHCVVVFRNQRLTPEGHTGFSRRFGDLLVHVLKQHNDPQVPEVLVLSNIVENGKPIGIQDGGQYWHTDLSYTAEPSRCSLLYSVEVPFENGVALGDTLFVNTCAAYDALSSEMKARLAGLKATHSYTARYQRMQQKGGTRVELDEEQKKAVPEVVHPIVRTHPFTGRKSLYVNEGFTIGIVGMPKHESDKLLGELYKHVTDERFIIATGGGSAICSCGTTARRSTMRSLITARISGGICGVLPCGARRRFDGIRHSGPRTRRSPGRVKRDPGAR